MEICEKCSSQQIEIQKKSFKEDLHNILTIFTCKSCGHEKTETNNLQIENN